MVEPDSSDEVATYEIRFRGEVPEGMREQLRAATIHSSPTETVLYREVTDVAELDQLLDRLQAMGLVLSELQESPTPANPAHPSSLGGDDE